MASNVEVGRGDVRAQTAGWLRSRPFNPAGEIAVIHPGNLSKPLRLLH